MPRSETISDAERRARSGRRRRARRPPSARSCARPGRQAARREAGDEAAGAHGRRGQPEHAGSRPPRPAGSRAPWRRRPGSCGAASGTRRSAPAPSASAKRADQRPAHEGELDEGGDEEVVQRIMPRCAGSRRACVVEGLAHAARAAGSRPSAPRRSGPRRPARAPAAALRGSRARTRSRSCSTATTVRRSPCQRRTSSSRSAVVLASIAVNGSSSRITRASCSSSRANSARCICPPDRDADRRAPRSRAGRRRRSRARSACAVVAPDAAEQAGAPPQAHGHHVVDADREGAVDLGDLRQVGDVAARQPSRSIAPASGRHERRRCP